MAECLRSNLGIARSLQLVVTEHCRGMQGGFDITRLHPVQALLRMVRPDTGQAIGLQLRTDLQSAIAADRLLFEQGFFERFGQSQFKLHVMPDFVGDDISPREVTDH
ncbi:hypothetical protein D9M71_558120 [compost metagenome]